MKVRNAYLVCFGAWIFVFICRLIFLTLRIERRHGEHAEVLPEDSRDRRYIFSIWHDSVVLPLFGGKTDRLAVLTSRHADGAFVSEALATVNVATVRGSTSRGGATAVREMMRLSKRSHLAITPDGPRGPARKMSPGIVFLSSRSGAPIVPTGFACSRCWRIRGRWTDLVIPQPFAKVVLLSDVPIAVPADVDDTQLPRYVAQLQTTMDRLDRRAQSYLRRAA
jgi:lysophospholipid acyltransferase (LPLAT)-like uncharacterized protein